MNKRELIVKRQLESEGWHVMHKGWPDFLVVKLDNSGNPIAWKTREVKSETNKLTYEQVVCQKILTKAGIPCEVQIVTSNELLEQSPLVKHELASKHINLNPSKIIHDYKRDGIVRSQIWKQT